MVGHAVHAGNDPILLMVNVCPLKSSTMIGKLVPGVAFAPVDKY